MAPVLTDLLPVFLTICHRSFQAGVIVLLILAIKRIFGKKISRAWHYSLWFVLMVHLVLPWSLESGFSLFNLIPVPMDPGQDGPVLEGMLTRSPMSSGAPASPSFSAWLEILSLVWASGACLILFWLLFRSLAFLTLVRRHSQITHEPTLTLLEDCKGMLGVKTVLVILETDLVRGPALFGYIRPRLLIPKGMIHTMDRSQLRLVFLHEICHLRHHDILTGWIMACLAAVHWFNPLVWLSLFLMRKDREYACDAGVLSRLAPDQQKNYGLMLVHLVSGQKRNKMLPGLTGIIETRTHIKRRIEMIAGFKKKSAGQTFMAAVCFSLFCLTVLTGATGSSTGKDLPGLAKDFTRLLAQNRHKEAVTWFDAAMKQALPPEKLKGVWGGILDQVGPFQKIRSTRSETFGDHEIVYVTCEFAKGPLDIKLVFDKTLKIAGLWVVPTRNIK